MASLESDQILEDLCYSNGLNYLEVKSSQYKGNENIKSLEMFFNGFPHILHMEKFPHLTELKIIAQELTTVSGLETCVNLNELWIAECKLNKISGLKSCRKLKKLYLYSNRLVKIENLEQLNLEILWLSDNKLTTIQGLGHMMDLVELNLARNYISSIGDSLNNLKNLEILNLSSNLIDNFQEITHLQNIPSLKHLCFRDPQYGLNPVTILCNYSLYVIYHLPGLISLDTLPISQKVVKELADSTINKKKLWYFMKLNTINRELNEMVEKIDSIKKKHSLPYLDQISNINCQIKQIQKEIHLLEFNNEQNESEIKAKEGSIKPLEDKIKEIEMNITFLDTQYKKCLETITQDIEVRKKFIYMELENGGNIRFEFSTNKNDGWYKSCYDLIMSRFCSTDYLTKSINGIKIKKIIRITNRVLIAKYEDKLLSDVEETEYINNKPSLRKKIDYLMYSWRPKLGNNKDELFNIIKNGFNDIATYRKNGYEEAIPFTNSLFLSDVARIENLKGAQTSRYTNNVPYKLGYGLLCKIYTNKFVDYNAGAVSPDTYPECFGVKKASVNSQENEASKRCECKSKQMEWFLFNKHLAVPEYIIEYEYLNRYNTDSIFEKELANLELKKNDKNMAIKQENESEDEPSKSEDDIEEIVSKEINIQSTKLEGLSSDNLTELNLHNVGLTTLDIDSINNLRFLKKLVVSFNKLTSIKEIVNLTSLEYLDASFNEIKSLNGIKSITKLSHLDLSNNQISEIMSLCNILKQNFPTLTYLDLNNNLVKRPTKLRPLILYSLRSLLTFNKQKINPNDKEFPESKSKLNKDIVKKYGGLLSSKPRCLRYSFVTDLYNDENNTFIFESADNFIEESNCSFESESELARESNNFYARITVLNIDNQGLYKLSNIEYLVNLRYASFNNNYISKIEGLEKCTKLEELSLENNLIQSLNGLENLESLRKLNLNNNEIIYYDDLHNKYDIATKNWELNLNRLTYLSISNNSISSVKFVLRLPSLIEFYASLNQIKNLREIFHLKSLNGLAILDLCSNPMCNDPKYRLFLIYHLKNLKSLDGSPIEQSELIDARESFGGKLTCDFIAEKFTHTRLCDIRSLEFPQCSIRLVDLGSTPQLIAEQFESLRSLNLENNNLTSFSGLIYLKNLKILCLNNNKIESIYPRQKQPISSLNINNNTNNNMNNINNNNNNSSNEIILPNLEVLHLAFNGINDLIVLQINKLTSLKALFLQGNEISRIEGIETLRDLRELVLDKNKIKAIGEVSFIGQTNRLLELHIEENRLRDLSNIQLLRHLQKLYVANNKINDFSDIDRLLDLNNLYEISLINNPISRRPHYRITMVYKIKRMRILDMLEINEDDRIKAEIYFCEQQQLQQPQLYYNGVVQPTPQIIATQMQNPSSINQLEHQFLALSQSPRLRPITLLDKQIITNNQVANNGSGTSNKKHIKNPFDKMNKEFTTRYRNQN